MSRCCMLAIVLCSSFLSAISNTPNTKHNTDDQALLGFKSKISSDPLGVLNSWNESLPFCQWSGITCGQQHERVTVLDLGSSKLVGTIAASVGNLSFLRELYVEGNTFVGRIPQEIGRLRRLEILSASNNSLNGGIPSSISGCSNLRYISIANNQIGGEIPKGFGLLSKLNFLMMSRNSLSGTIPSSFGNLSSLQTLLLSQNILSGIPDTLGQLQKLTTLSLAGNMFSGTIPASLFNLTSLTYFNMGVNQLQGSLPSDLFYGLQNIEYFGVAQNQMSGTIPISMSNATTLQRFQSTYNSIAGKIPSLDNLHKLRWLDFSYNLHGTGSEHDLDFVCSLTNATNLDQLGMDGNNFGGVLPECISNLSTTLRIFIVHGNAISGNIPPGIGNLIGPQAIDMAFNQLSGEIPYELGKLEKLVILYLERNCFTGNIPSSLGNLKVLTELNLESNSLTGTIPPHLGECSSLVSLDLSKNNLSGVIPTEIFQLSSLSIFFYLSHNRLIGTLPLEVGNLKNLGLLDVSENMLSGAIPATLGNCESLEILNMQGNLFEGPIPSSFSSLRGIMQLDVSRNNLSGQIPEFLESFTFLQKLNLSYNDLQGPVGMNGIFSNVSGFFVMGNSKLCGGARELHLPASNVRVSNEEKFPNALKFIVIAASSFLGICVLLFALYSSWLWLQKKRIQVSPNSTENSLLKLSYQSLLKATDGFSSDNLLGTGSFGSVYKGTLEMDGTIVAVKVLNLQNHRASKSFTSECDILKNIRHRNLVKLLTVCSGADFVGNDFKALVYEFMPNLSLEEWLHPVSKIDVKEEEDEGQRNLSLIERLNIAVDVANALDYLHNYSATPVVHCDIKPSNVLLDRDMTGHLSDFGLALFLFESSHSTIADATSFTGVRGTIGYAAPEYGLGTEVSMSGDMYSFGILLLEMFSGTKPTDDKFKGSLNLHNFVKTALPERVAEIADPSLFVLGNTRTGDYQRRSSLEDNRTRQCLIMIFEVGIACSAELPRERKSICEVAAELQSIREKLLD